jgi:asparagine synthetase B (glutamine-hydrolysing)
LALEPLTPYEVATGFPLGAGTSPPPSYWARTLAQRAQPAAALAAFESVVVEALQRPPCVVQFSGGRDSSAVLAVAADLARRHGLDLPVAQTVRFGGSAGGGGGGARVEGAGEAREDEWQELVVRHLGLPDWERVDAGEDADLLGPAAQRVLLRHGVIWSPVLATRSRYMEMAHGGSLISGEGGDEVLGRRRSANLSALLHVRALQPAGVLAKASATDVLPRSARTARWRRRLAASLGLEWLRTEVREEYLLRSARQWADEPLAWPHAVHWVTSCRHVHLGLASMTALASEAGTSLYAPFLDPRFVRAVAGAFGLLGPPSRTVAMRALFGHLLPEALVTRRTKAVFTLPAWGAQTRQFLSSWRGTGLDDSLVNVEALRRHWERPRPSAMTFCLLQKAWLESRTPG